MFHLIVLFHATETNGKLCENVPKSPFRFKVEGAFNLVNFKQSNYILTIIPC